MSPAARRFSCPEGVLAAEIKFAITYIVACNPDRIRELLGPEEQGGCRAQFSAQIAAMLTERAEKSLSGMSLEGDDTPAVKS
jgi:hypothetical protein